METLKQLAKEVQSHLETVILPYWKGMIDRENGGFYGYRDFSLALDPQAVKGVILNSRILWFFSNAYLTLGREEDLDYARHAYRFLMDSCLDPEYGGVYWSVRYDGTAPDDAMKHTYNQAFAIYALACYYRASRDEQALQTAMDLFRIIEEKTLDPYGYREAFSREWKEIDNEFLSENGLLADKTMNTLLHLLEAYTELLLARENPQVRARLTWIIDTFTQKVYNQEECRLEVFFDREFHSIANMHSYGHDIEASWLLDRACEVLGDPVRQQTVKVYSRQMADHVLRAGYWQGALRYGRFEGEINRQYVWWVQAEGVVGYLNQYEKTRDPLYLNVIEQLWAYIQQHLVDPRPNSEWFYEVNPDGTPVEKPITELWKCPYHNGRMCMEVLRRVEADGSEEAYDRI